MKALLERWQLLSRRVDAMTLRERVILFFSIAIGLIALADGFVVTPRMAEQKALTAQMRQQSAELVLMRKALEGGQANTPANKLAGELAQVAADQRATEEEITRRLAASASGTRLPELLERVLRRHDRLTLLTLVTAAPVARAPTKLPRQTVELSLRGGYADLLEYVAATEAALPGLRWGTLAITSTGTAGTSGTAGASGTSGASELSAQVFLVGALQ